MKISIIDLLVMKIIDYYKLIDDKIRLLID